MQENSLCSASSTAHSVHWGMNPPSQKYHPAFLPSPLQPANCPSTPFLGNPDLYIGFSLTPPPLKIGFFSEPQKY